MAVRTFNIGHILSLLALVVHSYARFRLPVCWHWHLTAVPVGKRQRSESNRVAGRRFFPILFGFCL